MQLIDENVDVIDRGRGLLLLTHPVGSVDLVPSPTGTVAHLRTVLPIHHEAPLR